MSEMIERVARALDPAAFNPPIGHEPGLCPTCDGNRDEARNRARIAIEAMREPTVGMLVVAYRMLGIPERPIIAKVYRAMFDAELSASQPSEDGK